MEDSVESVAQKRWGSYGPGGTDSEDLQGWILKFGEYRKRLRTSVDFFPTGYPTRACPGRPTVRLCPSASSCLTNRLEFAQSESGKLETSFC